MTRRIRAAAFPIVALALTAASCGESEEAVRLRETQSVLAARDAELAAAQARAAELAQKLTVAEAARNAAVAETASQVAAEKARGEAAAKAAEEKTERVEKDLKKVTAHRDELTEWVRDDLLPLAEKQSPELVNLKTATEEMMREVAALRGLEWKHPVMRRRIRREQVGEWMRRDMKKELPEAKAKEIVSVGAEMGLVPEGTDLYEIFAEFLEGGAAAFYKPDTRTFYHIEGNDGRGAYPVVFHELVHAIEDQHFDLDGVYRAVENDSDAALARRGLVEGSAALFQDVYQAKHPGDVAAMNRANNTPEMMQKQMRMLQRVPAFLVATMGLYPYNNGKTWLRKVTGGDPAKVSALFAEPPSSTEQVLHPEKYTDPATRDWPHRVEVPDLPKILGSWTPMEADGMGELMMGCLLAQLQFKGAAAALNLMDLTTGGVALKEPIRSAVAGWDGDRYVAALDPATGRATVAWITVWDTEKDADEWIAAYGPRMAKKLSADADAAKASPVRLVEPGTGRVTRIERHGRRVVMVLGSPAERADEIVAACVAAAVTADPRDAADSK